MKGGSPKPNPVAENKKPEDTDNKQKSGPVQFAGPPISGEQILSQNAPPTLIDHNSELFKKQTREGLDRLKAIYDQQYPAILAKVLLPYENRIYPATFQFYSEEDLIGFIEHQRKALAALEAERAYQAAPPRAATLDIERGGGAGLVDHSPSAHAGQIKSVGEVTCNVINASSWLVMGLAVAFVACMQFYLGVCLEGTGCYVATAGLGVAAGVFGGISSVVIVCYDYPFIIAVLCKCKFPVRHELPDRRE